LKTQLKLFLILALSDGLIACFHFIFTNERIGNKSILVVLQIE
jgi:hypothetical protein